MLLYNRKGHQEVPFKLITTLNIAILQSQHVPILNMYSLILVETINDMSFSPPDTKYDKPL